MSSNIRKGPPNQYRSTEIRRCSRRKSRIQTQVLSRSLSCIVQKRKRNKYSEKETTRYKWKNAVYDTSKQVSRPVHENEGGAKIFFEEREKNSSSYFRKKVLKRSMNEPASGSFVYDQLHWHVSPRKRQDPDCCRRALQQACDGSHERHHCFCLRDL